MDGRVNNGGARPGAGSKGYGHQRFIKEKVVAHSEQWWTEWEMMMNGDDKSDRKYAMGEFNKLQAKMLPTALEGGEDGAAIVVNISKNIADKNGLNPSTGQDSGGQA